MVRWPIMLLAFFAFGIAAFLGDARALDPSLREANMTRADYDRIIRVATDGGASDEAPLPVHNLDDTAKNDLRQAGSVRAVKGAQWLRQSPEKRQALLRDARAAMPDADFLLLVPKGEVWAIPRGRIDDLRDLQKAFRPWTGEEYEALPEHLHLQPKLKHQGGKGNKGKTVR
ncbi:MAG: hypothetical protein JNL25_12765 [Rhodospirillaceae bacterium]|nr:hypothetical protein [Rhodospirillaceae bacterium]